MTANFMTFADVVEGEDYDLWVGDEGWDLDYYLHENPELKRAPYVFITDFIGVLPMRDDRTSTEFLRAGRRTPRTSTTFACIPTCATCRSWSATRPTCSTGSSDPICPNMRAVGAGALPVLRLHVPLRPGGLSRPPGPAPRARLPGRRAGDPRLGRRDPGRAPPAREVRRGVRRRSRHSSRTRGWSWWPGRGSIRAELPSRPRIEVRPFVPDLFRHHAAADLAIVQGGLTTTMELAALRTPFLYFPLRNHFEQQTSRGAPPGPARRRHAYPLRPDHPEALGAAIVDHLGKACPQRAVPLDGTDRAARMIADLL